MLTIIKVLVILFLLCLWENGTSRQLSKQISILSFQLSVQVCPLLDQSEGYRKVFLWGCKMGGYIVRLPPRALGCHKRWKVSAFVKFEIILPLLCFLLDAITNRHYRTMEFKFVDRFQDLSKVKNPAVRIAKI